MAFPDELLDWMIAKTLPDASLPNLFATGHGSRQDGYFALDRPPAGHFNRMMYIVSKWIAFVNGIQGEALKWVVTQTYDTGDDSIASLEDLFVPDAFHEFAKLSYDTGAFVRLIVGADGAFVVTINARWVVGSAEWSQGDATRSSVKLLWSINNGLKVQAKAAGASDWADTAWDTEPFRLGNPLFATVNKLANGIELGTELLTTAVQMATARLTVKRGTNATSIRTLVFAFPDPTGVGQWIRLYRAGFDGECWEVSYNAQWGVAGAQSWTYDVSTIRPTLLQYTPKRIAVIKALKKNGSEGGSAVNPWLDNVAGWDLGYPLYQWYFDTDYDNTTAFKNTLTHANTPKVLCLLNFDGTGAVPAINAGAAFNAITPTYPSTDLLRITFPAAFALTAGWIAVPIVQDFTRALNADATTPIALKEVVVAKTGTTLDIRLRDTASAKTIQLNHGLGADFLGSIAILAFGAQ